MLAQRFIINLRHAATPSAADSTPTAMRSYGWGSRLANTDNIVGDMGQDLEFAHERVEDAFADADEEIQVD